MTDQNLSQLTKEELIEIINEKTDYLSMIVHQVRTPLTAQKWFLEMLCSGNLGFKIPADKKDTIVQASESVDSSLKLLQEVSEINHASQWKLQFTPKKVSLREILEKSIQMFTSEALIKHVSIVLHTDDTDPYEILADDDKLSIVFQNIIENAIKYSPAGTVVDITIESLTESFVVMITDHGIGIPFEDQKNIFKKLYRASNAITSATGTGLGLYIAREICQYHHGSVWFESIPDIGTTFFIQLPIYRENTAL